MRGRKRIIGLAAMLSIILIVSGVFASGLVPKLSLFSSPAVEPLSPGPASVFVDPSKIIKDYLKDPAYQKGKTFRVYVNVSDVSLLFTWQINVTWFKNPTLNKAILNVSRIIASEFLARSPNQTSSEVLGFVINATDNVRGNVGFAEAVLGNTAVTGSGRLVEIEFLIVGYGSVDLTISLTGTLKTTMLNSTGGSITFTATNGVFRNKLKGDVDMDGDVDFAYDWPAFRASYGKLSGQPGYNREADTDYDGDVDFAVDWPDFRSNYGKFVSV